MTHAVNQGEYMQSNMLKEDMLNDLRLNPTFMERFYSHFKQLDRNKDGILDLNDIMQIGKQLKILTNASDAQIEPVQNALRVHFTAFGVTESGITQEVFIDNILRLIANEIKFLKFKDSAEPRREINNRQLHDAFFDFFDSTNNGYMTIDQIKIGLACFGFPVEGASKFFISKDGRFDREAYYTIAEKYWLEMDNSEEVQNMYGEEYTDKVTDFWFEPDKNFSNMTCNGECTNPDHGHFHS